MNQDTGATGLFSGGTTVPAIVRFSGGQDNSVWKEGKKPAIWYRGKIISIPK